LQEFLCFYFAKDFIVETLIIKTRKNGEVRLLIFSALVNAVIIAQNEQILKCRSQTIKKSSEK